MQFRLGTDGLEPSTRASMMIDHPADGSFDASNFLGDGLKPAATVDNEESNLTNLCLFEMKSSTTTNSNAVLQFALNSLNTADYPSFVKQRESTLTFPEKVR